MCRHSILPLSLNKLTIYGPMPRAYIDTVKVIETTTKSIGGRHAHLGCCCWLQLLHLLPNSKQNSTMMMTRVVVPSFVRHTTAKLAKLQRILLTSQINHKHLALTSHHRYVTLWINCTSCVLLCVCVFSSTYRTREIFILSAVAHSSHTAIIILS